MKRTPRRMSNYLWDRPNTDFIWFSRAVPKRLWDAEGRKVVQFSLETSDRKKAEALARQHATELDRRWGLLTAPATLQTVRRVPTDHDLEEAAVVLAHDLLLEEADGGREDVRGMGPDFWRSYVDWAQIELEQQQRYTATGDYGLILDHADELIEALDFEAPVGGERHSALCDILNKVRLDALRVKVQRASGNLEAQPKSAIVARVRERQAATAVTGETVLELFERWSEEQLAKGEKRPDTVEQDRKKLRQFADFVGKGRAVRSITAIEIAEYRDTLRNLPPKWRDKKEFRGMGVREAAAKARELDLPKMAFTTVNSHLSVISPLFDWLRKQPAWAGLTNPCDGLHYAKVKGKKRRPSFRTDQLNTILGSPLFKGFADDGREHEPGSKFADDWRKWIPLVAMFTGARIGEIAQLRIGDVRLERGVWFIHIRHDEGEGLSTKSGLSRPAAVHTILEAAGFIAFHSRRAALAGSDLSQPLFPEIEANSRGQVSGMPSRWWRNYLARIGVKDGADGFGAHSFRHTLADRLRVEAELLDDQVEVCLGHNQKTTTSGYGGVPQGTVTLFKAWMDAVRFDGVEFGHLL